MQVKKDQLAATIRANGPPVYHYQSLDDGEHDEDEDNFQCLSVREAAAIQSFPNKYKFFGNLSSQYRQVGNAVPRKLARAVASSALRVLEFVYAEELPQTDSRKRKAESAGLI